MYIILNNKYCLVTKRHGGAYSIQLPSVDDKMNQSSGLVVVVVVIVVVEVIV